MGAPPKNSGAASREKKAAHNADTGILTAVPFPVKEDAKRG
jgi:hypothetical protein